MRGIFFFFFFFSNCLSVTRIPKNFYTEALCNNIKRLFTFWLNSEVSRKIWCKFSFKGIIYLFMRNTYYKATLYKIRLSIVRPLHTFIIVPATSASLALILTYSNNLKMLLVYTWKKVCINSCIKFYFKFSDSFFVSIFLHHQVFCNTS